MASACPSEHKRAPGLSLCHFVESPYDNFVKSTNLKARRKVALPAASCGSICFLGTREGLRSSACMQKMRSDPPKTLKSLTQSAPFNMPSCKGNCGFIYFVKARKTNKAWVAKDVLLRQTRLLSPEATCAQKQAACVHHAEPPGKAPVQGWVTRVAPSRSVIAPAHSWGKVRDTSNHRPQISPVPLFGAHSHRDVCPVTCTGHW